MPPIKFYAGQTFLIEIPSPTTLHLFILILEPNPKSGQTIIIPIDSRNLDNVSTVELKPGDHPFIKVQSFVTYSLARIVTTSELETLIRKGKAKEKDPISSEILGKIKEKITHSKGVKNDIREFYINETWLF